MHDSALLVTAEGSLEAVRIVRHLRRRDGSVAVLVRDRSGGYAAVCPDRLLTRDRLVFV